MFFSKNHVPFKRECVDRHLIVYINKWDSVIYDICMEGRNVPKTICSVTGVMAVVVDVGDIQMSLSLSYAVCER